MDYMYIEDLLFGEVITTTEKLTDEQIGTLKDVIKNEIERVTKEFSEAIRDTWSFSSEDRSGKTFSIINHGTHLEGMVTEWDTADHA